MAQGEFSLCPPHHVCGFRLNCFKRQAAAVITVTGLYLHAGCRQRDIGRNQGHGGWFKLLACRRIGPGSVVGIRAQRITDEDQMGFAGEAEVIADKMRLGAGYGLNIPREVLGQIGLAVDAVKLFTAEHIANAIACRKFFQFL